MNFELGSFRDPAGKVFYEEKKVFRYVTTQGQKKYEYIKSNGILNDSIKDGYLIETREIKDEKIKSQISNCKYILQHQLIDFISYPYEWSFNQLKDAALHHLNYQIYLLEKNAILIDGSAYNIQFIGTKPIFIDVLSIGEYRDGMYWYGHKQFCENFLNPLLLSSKKEIYFNNWFKGNLEGIFTSDLNSILNFIDKLSPTIFLQVFMLNKLENKTILDPNKSSKKLKKLRNFSKKSYMSLLYQMKKTIKKLEPYKRKSVWENYSKQNTYTKEEEILKIKTVKDFVLKNNFNLIADVGCNDGLYSFASLESGCKKVVGFDFDLNVVDRAYLEAKNKNHSFLPLYLDASNPSSNIGWNETERKGLKQRFNFDGLIALAIEHHLAISKNIPLDQTIDWLTSFAPKGLIEFVPKEDETVQSMIILKGDIFPNYTEENFIKFLGNKTKIISSTKVSSSGRKLFEYARI